MKKIEKEIQEAQKERKPHKIKKITKQQIIHQIWTFYFAGIDSTGHLIAMAFYSIAQYPECYAKIVEEIKNTISLKDQFTYEKLEKLQYMSKFLDECLRMWPPATGLLNRVTKAQTVIGPFTLPADFNIGTSIVSLMHNQKFYKNPERFDPERWNDKSNSNNEAYSFIPFSAGPRSCIGKYMSLMQAKIMLILFLQNFQIKRTDVPLRMQTKFLYGPIEQDLVYFVMKERNNNQKQTCFN